MRELEKKGAGASTSPVPDHLTELANGTTRHSYHTARRRNGQGLFICFETGTREGWIAFERFMAPRLEAEYLIITKDLSESIARALEREAWKKAVAIALRLGAAFRVSDYDLLLKERGGLS